MRSRPWTQEDLWYRSAYGFAANRKEIETFSTAYGRDVARLDGTTKEDLIRVVNEEAPGIPPEIVEEAVDDVLEGRSPRC